MKRRHTYAADVVLLGEPGPVGGERVAVADAHQHSFVLLVAVLRVLVRSHVRKCCRRKSHLLAAPTFSCSSVL